MTQFGTRLFRHSGSVSAMFVTPGGERLVTSSTTADETVIWNTTTGERTFTLDEPASHVALTPDGQRLLTAFASLYVTDVATAKRITPPQFSALKTPLAASHSGTFAAYCPNDSCVVLASFSGQILRKVPVEKPVALALSPNGRLLAVASKQRGLRVLRTLDQLELFADTRVCYAVTFARDGHYLLSAGEDHAQLWSIPDKRAVWRRSVDARIEGVALSPKTGHAAIADCWGNIQLFAVSDGRDGASFKIQRGEPLLAFLDEDTLACVRASAIKFHSAASGEEVFCENAHDAEVTQVAVDATGSIAATSSIDHTTRVWDVRSGAQLAAFTHDNAVYGVALAPNGSRVASASADDTLRVWALPDTNLVGKLQRSGAELGEACVVFSPNSQLLATDVEGGVQVLRADNLAPVSTLPTVRPRRLAFLDDQRLLLLSERQISVVDAASGHCFCKEVDNYDDLLAVSPDGLRCAVRIDEHVVVRDTQHLREINRFRVFLATDCAFSHDAGLLACTRFGEPHVELWHIDSATLEDEMRLDARPAALAFVGKKTLFVAMRDGSAETVKLSLTAREREHQAAREFSEREEHARDCLRQLAMRTAPGYRDSPGREYLDADGLGLRLPGLEDHQATLRIAMDSDTYNIEIRVGATGAQPAPRASFVRLARWIRTRLHPPAPAQDPRDAQFISELESTASIESARVDRVKGEALTIEIRSRTVPDPEAMRQWVARGLELSREQ